MVMLALNPNIDQPLELVRPHMDFLDLNATIEPFWTCEHHSKLVQEIEDTCLKTWKLEIQCLIERQGLSKRQTLNSPSKLPKTRDCSPTILTSAIIGEWVNSEQVNNDQVNDEGVNRLKGIRKNFYSIFHATSTNIFRTFSCHVDLIFLT